MATVDATNAQNTSESLVADTYSLTDNQLADSLEFIEEIGFGNWGSVWSCRSRIGSSRRKLAVKLVHRTAERTTAARVRSLWNEMKIVRTLKEDRHPAIIDFHSFVITPSYALITMEYLPRLVPVEVREPKAKLWFESLLGGIAHLHARGIVHNDIKPANILLSRNEQPVLVDFGFAEKYELLDGAESFVEVVPSSKTSSSQRRGSASSSQPTNASLSSTTKPVPFESSLAYGTPEYLSPERARGYKHDTRKSDVWSLGVTFFEIITGRTPFEVDENEEFTSKEDLERYWARTNSGEWVGTWKMSSGLERVLRKMLRPNVIERASAADSLRDAYFTLPHIDAEITSVRLTANGSKDISQFTIGSEGISTKGLAPTSPEPRSPSRQTDASMRSKLSALLVAKPQLPSTPNNRGTTSGKIVKKSSPKASSPSTKDRENLRSPTPNAASASSARSPTPASIPRAPTPSNIALPLSPITPKAEDSEKGRPRSFFGTHKRAKSPTPLTPKAVAPPEPPRVPPSTPASPTPRTRRTSILGAMSFGLGGAAAKKAAQQQQEEAALVPAPLAAAQILQKQAAEKAGFVVVESPPKSPVSPSPAASKSRPTGPPSNVAARLRAVSPTTANASSGAPSTSTAKPVTPIRSVLRPIAGKENASSVRVKVRAIESRAGTANSSSATTTAAAAGTVKSRIGDSPAKTGLRVKDRNRLGDSVGAGANKPAAAAAAVPATPVKGGGVAFPSSNTSVRPGKENASNATKRRSFLGKKPSAVLKENAVAESSDKVTQQAADKVEKQASRGRRALHAISRSVDLGRGKGDVPMSPMSHLGHSVRKSIDRTADFFGSLGANGSQSQKNSRNPTHKMDLQELQDSWDMLEKDANFRAGVGLSTVADTSQEDPESPPPMQSEIIPEAPEFVPTPVGEEAGASSKRASRMEIWIQDVQKSAEVAREEEEQRKAEAVGDMSTVSRASASFSADMGRQCSAGVAVLRKLSTEPFVSLPPPNRRGSVSSRKVVSRAGSTSVTDVLATSAMRLSAVLDDESKRILREGGVPMSTGSIDSTEVPEEYPTIPTILPEDLPSSNPDETTSSSQQPAETQPSTSMSTSKPYGVESSRAYLNPKSSLDLGKLAEEVGVNKHPWAAPRNLRSPTPGPSTPVTQEHPVPSATPSPPPVQHRRSSIQIATPPAPKRPVAPESVLVIGDNVVRVGNGYESIKSHKGRAPHAPSSFHRARHSTENLVAADESFSYENPRSESTRAKNQANRRSGIFATLRGKQHEVQGISSAQYFAAMQANEFVVVPADVEPTSVPETMSPQPHTPEEVVAPPQQDTFAGQRSDTLSNRLRKAFKRVVSTQDMNRSPPIRVGAA